jgi:competence protein ComEA
MFSRILHSIQDYFGYSRQETRGFVAILALMLACWLGPLAYRKLLPVKVEDNAKIQHLDSLVAVLNTIKIEENAKRAYQNYPKYTENTSYNSPEQPRILNDFDPNTATIEQLQNLGFPRFLAERIEKYRSKGGKFRKKEDLQRIYGLQPALYDKLEPYIQITTTKPTFESATNNTPLNTNTTTDHKPVFTKPKITTFDINTADTSDLIKLRGIGSKLALRIIKFRDGLGGFYSTNQYSEVFGLDSLALSELGRYAQVRTAVKKINLNTASPEELDRLPYLSFKQSQVIVRFREQHGAFKTADELLKIKILDTKIIDKISPYLSFD